MTVKKLLNSIDRPAPAFVDIVTRTRAGEPESVGGVKIPTEQAMKRPVPNAVQEIAE